MKNKKGFTLIELLAVIVILAIIALIATPIVLNIIKESKDSATIRSANFYMDSVENSLAANMLDGSKIEDGHYIIMENGDLCLELNKDKTCKRGLIKVEVSGKIPEKGNIIIIGSKLEKVDLLVDNKEIFKYNGEIVFNNGVIKTSDSVGTIILNGEIENSHPHITYDAILDGTTMPTIPAKLKYTNGKEKDVTFYYTGAGSVSGSDDTQIGYWTYFENGEVTRNADGTYSGTGDSITLTSNTYDNDDIPEFTPTQHRIGTTVLNKYESVEILGAVAKFELSGFLKFEPTGTKIIYENGEPVGVEEGELIPYFEDGTKVKNIILTYENNSQQIINIDQYKKMISIFEDNPSTQEYMLENISEDYLEIYGLFEQPAALGFQADGEIAVLLVGDNDYICNKLSKLSKITIEEEVDGKLEKKTFDVFNPIEDFLKK